MASNFEANQQSKGCCPPDAAPHMPEDMNYVCKGRMITFREEVEVNAYIVGSGKRCLLFIHDIFGLPSGHNKKLCDLLASRLEDTVVIAPDFFPRGLILGNADPIGYWNITFSIIGAICGSLLWCRNPLSFIMENAWEGSVDAIFNSTTSFLRKEHGVESFGLIGFCWGSYMNVKAKLGARDRDLIKCLIAFHPSVETLAPRWNENDEGLVRRAECPQLYCNTPQDSVKYNPGAAIQQLLRQREDTLPPEIPRSEFYVSTQYHGYMTRGDLSDPVLKAEVELGVARTIEFFNKCMPL